MIVSGLRLLFSNKAKEWGFTAYEALGSDIAWLLCVAALLYLGVFD